MKRFFPMVPLCAAVLALAGCMVAYRPAGLNGGHSFNRLGPDTFEVTFQSNTNLFGERLRDYCLLRAAEVTREYGFDYFAVEGELYGELHRVIPSTNTTTVTTPAPASIRGSGSPSSSNPSTISTTVSTMGSTQVGLPNFTLRIRCFKTYPTVAHTGTVLDAQSVREELAAKYEIALN